MPTKFDKKMEALQHRNAEDLAISDRRKLKGPAGMMHDLKRQLAARYSLPLDAVITDPMEFLDRLMAGFWPGDMELRQVLPKGVEDMIVPISIRLEAAKILLPFMRSKRPTQITGPHGGPIPIATLDVTEMMKVPELRKRVEELQLEMARQKNLQAADIVDVTIVEGDELDGPALDKCADPDSTGEAS